MGFSYKYFEKEFRLRTKELIKAYDKGDLLKTISYLKYLSNFYYLINYKLTDDQLEDLTSGVSYQLLGETVIDCCRKKTVLFYDNFGLAVRGLANIYVKALDRLGYHVFWVLYEYAPELEKLKEMYHDYKNVEFLIIPNVDIINRMRLLQRMILDIRPEHIFVYTTPEDVAGVGVMSTLSGDTDRYLIDLTDHAFWLGKCAVDYVIGFRNYGFNIAAQGRGIDPDRICLLPYYPDRGKPKKFQGMPFDTDRHEFVFSGGSIYKIEGDSTYERIVDYILKNYPQMYFVYAGNGKSRKLAVLKKNYPDRFFHIRERDDLDEVLAKAKFFLATIPVSGGLMVQYALMNQCIPMSYCTEQGGLSDPHTFLLYPEKIKFVFYKEKQLTDEIDRILTDKSYYLYAKQQIDGQVITEKEFTDELLNVLENKKTKFAKVKKSFCMDKFLESYKNRADFKQYADIIYHSHNKWVWKKHPFIIRKYKNKLRDSIKHT